MVDESLSLEEVRADQNYFYINVIYYVLTKKDPLRGNVVRLSSTRHTYYNVRVIRNEPLVCLIVSGRKQGTERKKVNSRSAPQFFRLL